MAITQSQLDEMLRDGSLGDLPAGRPTSGVFRKGRPHGTTAAARLRWLRRHNDRVFQEFLSGKYVKTVKKDGSVVLDLPAAEEAAGRRLSSKGVYVLQAIGTSRYKIGWGKKLASRIETIRNASPYPIEIFTYIRCDDPLSLEKKLHTQFAAKRVWREWFELGAGELLDLIELSK